MANAEQGKASFVIGKGTPEEKTYTLQFTFEALEAIETETGESIETVFSRIQDPAKRRLKDVRILIYAALREHHPEITMKLAGTLIMAATTGPIYEALLQAAEAAFPDSTGAGDGGAEVNPTAAKAGAGTGTG